MVIILIGILALVAVPRLIGDDTFSLSTYQARMVSALRNVQIKALNDTRAGLCFNLNFKTGVASSQPAFGYASNFPHNCGGIDFAAADQGTASITGQVELQDAGIGLTLQNGNGQALTSISFDSLGRAVQCDSGCAATLMGERSLYVCINGEGYIYPSSQLCN